MTSNFYLTFFFSAYKQEAHKIMMSAWSDHFNLSNSWQIYTKCGRSFMLLKNNPQVHFLISYYRLKNRNEIANVSGLSDTSAI